MSSQNERRRISKSDWKTVKWMLGTFDKERWQVLILIVANTINAVLTVMYADFSKRIINAASEDHSLEKVIYNTVAFLILIMFQLILNLLSRSFAERCKARIEVTLRAHILNTVMRKDYSGVTKYHTGEIQNRMTSDVTTISDGFTTIIPNVVYFIVKLVTAFVYLIILDKLFAVVFLVGGILVFFFTVVFRGVLKRLHKNVQATEGKVRSFIQEILTSLLVIKSFVSEDKVSDQAGVLMEENYNAKMKRRFFGICANAGISTVFNLGYVFALSFGAYRLLNGMPFGDLAAMLTLVNQIQQPFSALSGMLSKYFAVLASAERIIELDNIPDEIEENEYDINVEYFYDKLQTIEFNNITFRYDRDVILDNTSLTVNKGDFVAIMGISGIGKSTLLKLLLGVFRVESGEIWLNTSEGDVKVDCHTRRLFTFVPQGNFLLSGTIRENLTFINSDATEDEIDEAVHIACADKFLDELPDGLETVIGERGIGLSEGQLQRLAIARAILSKSPVMLLDEATSALDEETELQFLKNLRQMKNKTCIIVSHKKAALEICNKHIQIVDGKIVMEEKQ